MKKFKLAMIAASLWMPVFAYAEGLPWLTFRIADDTELSVPAENLSIVYQDGNLILSSSSVEKTIPSNEIKSMRFTATSAAVKDIIDINSATEDYYNLSGINVGNFSSIEEARRTLPSGIYIVKCDAKTFKVTL